MFLLIFVKNCFGIIENILVVTPFGVKQYLIKNVYVVRMTSFGVD